MLQAAEFGKGVIRIASDYNDFYMTLVYWVRKIQLHCSVQMELLNGVVVDINAICTELDPKCLELMIMDVLSGCDTLSHPFNNGKIIALNTLRYLFF